MSIVRLEKISISFAGRSVLDGIDMRLEKGDRVGLIGRNGTGKSTLFRILTGVLEPESGLVERMKRASIAHLEQLPDVPPETPLQEIVEEQFQDLRTLEEELKTLEHAMADGGPEIIEKYGALQERFRLDGGYDYHQRISRVLTGLGFSEEEFMLPFGSLSGGQRTRLMLALVLLKDADLLLLDEPENHLDLQAREWLESFLADWPKAFVIISHDRQMLNQVTSRTLEVTGEKLRGFTGPYDAYLKEMKLLRENQEQSYRRQQEFIEREESWINRFRYKNTKARQVQSRIKRLEKLERIAAPETVGRTGTFSLGEVARSGQVVLEARDLSMAYGDLTLYREVSFNVERGERVGIIGPNGAGKTTLLRQLRGQLEGGSGDVTLGHKVSIGYYDQQLDGMNVSATVLDEVGVAKPSLRPEQLRTFLGRFLFMGEDVFKPVSALSGGERSRVALAKLVLGKANLLLLDEPTNHLDIASREALEASLLEFPGTIILVSHDRVLVDKIVEKLIVVEGGIATVYLGNYSHYRWKKRAQEDEKGRYENALAIREPKHRRPGAGKAGEREQRKRRKRLEGYETAIQQMERELESVESRLAQVDPQDYQTTADLGRDYKRLRDALQAHYAAWERLSEQLSG